MSYTNATFHIDLENGSDSARTALTTVTVSNPSGTITRANKTAHGLVTGAVVDMTLFTAWLNAAWKITVFDADNFDLDAAVWQSTADANGTATPRGGSRKADAWKTFATGATAARIAPGDTIRVMASPDETLVGNATWTYLSKTVTLAGAVTANISDCETAWTASANATATTSTAQFKENTKSANLAIAGAFTTGLCAYFATGTLDLSGYQQVSFWVYSSAAVTAGTLSLRLCTDTAGAVSVHTIAIPAIPMTSRWVPVVVDLGGALNSAVASVALYQDTDIAAVTLNIDNIIACKSSSSADSLNLTSLIGKVWNGSWVASTTYSANDIRIPTQPNRNGYRYKVTAGGGGAAGPSEPTWPQEVGVTVTDGALTWTCEGLEDTWYGIQSINGTTVKLDGDAQTLGNAGRGYAGITETVATYKRELIKQTIAGIFSGYNTVSKAGTQGSNISFIGGWNRTDMSTRTGETWIDGQNGSFVYGYSCSLAFITLDNLSSVRCYTGLNANGVVGGVYKNTHQNSHSNNAFDSGGNSYSSSIVGMCCNNNAATGLNAAGIIGPGRAITCNNNGQYGITQNGGGNGAVVKIIDVVIKNNVYGFVVSAIGNDTPRFFGLISAANTTAGLQTTSPIDVLLNNCSITDSNPFTINGAGYDKYFWSQKHNQTADSHLGITDGGTITSATDQRHTASGIAWKFRPTSTTRGVAYPLRLSVAKIACTANTAVNVQIWTRRDSTNINGTLKITGGQIAGVPADVTVACAPSINTWTLSSALTFTPTETGVVEITFECYDGVGTSNNLWCDDIVIS